MKCIGTTAFVIGLVLAAGCEQSKQIPETFQARLDAADAMVNDVQKQQAFKKIAEDAADAGEADVAHKALSKIANDVTKEALAEAFALKFAKRGDLKASRSFADLMSNDVKKQEVLRKIANGGQ